MDPDENNGFLATAAAPSSMHAHPVSSAPPHDYMNSFPDISTIEIFNGRNFKRWQDSVFSILDIYGFSFALTHPKPAVSSSTQMVFWTYAVCRHTIISTLSNELFDVYANSKEAKEIWDSIITRYAIEDAAKQKFVIGNFYRWEMEDDKEIMVQINEYCKLVEDLKLANITLPEEFIVGLLIEKLPESWADYKNQLKIRHKQLSLSKLINHIIIEDENRKDDRSTKEEEIARKANLVKNKPHKSCNKNDKKLDNNRPKPTTFKKKGNCYVCGKPGHHAPQCRKRFRWNDKLLRPNANMAEAGDIISKITSSLNQSSSHC